jgi:plasmid stabilization system protein ParE
MEAPLHNATDHSAEPFNRIRYDFLEGLIEAIERLADFPMMGRPRSAFFPGLRNLAALDLADRMEGE